jgi:hypothetical protein
VIERPVFKFAPPRSGGTALFRSLARSPNVFSANGGVLEGIFELEPENREWDYPEIAEEGSDASTNSFVLPEAQPAAG